MILLAAKELNDTTVSPGVLGFSVFLGMALLTYLLIRSFLKQLRKVRVNDERRRAEEADPAGEPVVSSSGKTPSTPPPPPGPPS